MKKGYFLILSLFLVVQACSESLEPKENVATKSWFYEGGGLRKQKWYYPDSVTKVRTYYEDGVIDSKYWLKNGEWNDSAYFYDSLGRLSQKRFFLDGMKYGNHYLYEYENDELVKTEVLEYVLDSIFPDDHNLNQWVSFNKDGELDSQEGYYYQIWNYQKGDKGVSFNLKADTAGYDSLYVILKWEEEGEEESQRIMDPNRDGIFWVEVSDSLIKKKDFEAELYYYDEYNEEDSTYQMMMHLVRKKSFFESDELIFE